MTKLLKHSFPILVWPGSVFFLHLIATWFGLYWTIRWLDTPFHLAGGASIALATYFWLKNIAKPKSILWLAMVGTTALAAVFWEFAEYIGDVVLLTSMQLSLFDTLKDLYCGIVGAVVVVLILTAKPAK